MFPSNAGYSPPFIKRAPLISKRASLINERAHKARFAREIFAPAKLNLYLEVLGSRADGFHALETLMVPVRVYDQLSWRENTFAESSAGSSAVSSVGLTLQVCSLLPAHSMAKRPSSCRQLPGQLQGDQLLGDPMKGDPMMGELSENLVLRAARLLAKTAGVVPDGQFELIKRIPIQAGMGGGSSDAAAALVLANDVWGIGYSRQQLLPLATQLGSDVPFFLNRYFTGHGAAVCRGRGELIEPIARLPRLHFVVLKPAAGLSTAEVFAELRQRTDTGDAVAKTSQARLSRLIACLQSGNLAAAGEAMTNRLEFAATRLAPWLADLHRMFMGLGCWGQFLTGSGSAYVGVMRSAAQARSAARRLAGMNCRAGSSLGNVFVTSNC